MLAVLLPALLTGLATTIGAVPFLFMRGVARRTYDTLLGFGAGLMLAAATLGLLSAALEDVRQAGELKPARLALVLAGFAAGAALLRIMDGFIPHEHAGGHHEHVQQDGHGHDHGDDYGHGGDHGHDHDDDHGHGDGRGHGHDHGHSDDHGHDHDHGVADRDVHKVQQGAAKRVQSAASSTRGDHLHFEPHCDLDPQLAAGDRTARAQGLLVVGVMFLHRVPEGLAIGAAWAGGGSALGLTLVAAIGVQNAVEGGVMSAPLRRGGLGPKALLALVTATGLAVPLAALLGYFLSSRVAGALPPMLSLAAGALLYLTCNEIIPESHSHGNELRATYGLLSGFIVIMLLKVVFGHDH